MKYEVNGRDDFENNALGAPDLQITGIDSNHVKVTNFDSRQSVVYSIGAAASFPASWNSLGPGETQTVKMGAATQVNFRKKVFYRNILRNDDNTTRLNDVTVTVGVEKIDLHV